MYADTVKVFQLQRRMRGVEVAVGAFFNGSDFMMPININFEHKPLFPGDIGPATGEMGTCMYWSEPNKLFSATLAKLRDRLAEEGYVGYMDVNCIVNGKGIYPLEFTTRFGFPQIYLQRAGIQEPFGEMLFKVASGQKFTIKTKMGFQLSKTETSNTNLPTDQRSSRRCSRRTLRLGMARSRRLRLYRRVE